VGIIAHENTSLLGVVSAMAPVMAGGNTCVLLASESKPLCAVSFAEVLHSSDVPGGVINILTGFKKELLEPVASHLDINALVYYGNNPQEITAVKELAALNVKRIFTYSDVKNNEPYKILDTQEIKTTWHPIENIGSSGGGY